MNTLFSKNNLKNLRFKLLKAAVLLFLFCSHSFGQMGTMQVNPNISSGIIIPIDQTNEVGVVQFKIPGLTENIYSQIFKEFVKYDGEIVNCGYSIVDEKLIVSYKSPSYPNFLLAILDRVNIIGYYDLNGIDTYYIKDGYSAFIR